MLDRNTGRFTVLTCACVLVVACGIQLLRPANSYGQNGRSSKGKLSGVQAEDLNWPMPPGVEKSYDAIDGTKLHGYVEELSALSERYRDAGNQWWGRIAGTPSMTESQNWFKQKLGAMGIETQTVTISDPQDLPKSWDGTVSAGGKTLKLESSIPAHRFRQIRAYDKR